MDLNRLRLFVEVADHKGFSAAAKSLGMQRSSLSRAIAALEADLRVQLFQRTTRAVALTTAGDALHAKVAGHLRSLADAVEELPEQDEEAAGPLKVTVSVDVGAEVFARVVAGFSRRYPRVQVNVVVTNRVVDLVSEGFDAALRPGPLSLPDSSLRARLLTTVTGGFYASPNYLARAGTPRTIEDIVKHDWIESATDGVRIADFQRPPVVRADDLLFVRQALREGLGVGLLPAYLARDDIKNGRLVKLLNEPQPIEGGFWLMTAPGDHVPRKVRVFRDYLVEWFRDGP